MIRNSENQNIVIIGIGSNLIDGAELCIQRAISLIEKFGIVVKQSSIYSSKPFARPDSILLYHNSVIEVLTDLAYDDFLRRTKDIEYILGRYHHSDSVAIDIDIVYWNMELLRPNEIKRDYFLIGYQQLH